eukprot:Tbor_TRINITY_DN4570_c0_g1::TRINITY_DN4570_c0_g1_i1::g.15736::m.15736
MSDISGSDTTHNGSSLTNEGSLTNEEGSNPGSLSESITDVNTTQEFKMGKLKGNCIQCDLPMGKILGVQTPHGPVHNDCVPYYNKNNEEYCKHCDLVLTEGKILIIKGEKVHPDCAPDYKAGRPYVLPTKKGSLRKFSTGRGFTGVKNWRERFFCVSPNINGLAYFANKGDFETGSKPKGIIKFTEDIRLIQHPLREVHPEASNPSKDFILVFKEDGKEFKLLMSAATWQEHDEWTNILKAYIKIIDHPDDIPKVI